MAHIFVAGSPPIEVHPLWSADVINGLS